MASADTRQSVFQHRWSAVAPPTPPPINDGQKRRQQHPAPPPPFPRLCPKRTFPSAALRTPTAGTPPAASHHARHVFPSGLPLRSRRPPAPRVTSTPARRARSNAAASSALSRWGTAREPVPRALAACPRARRRTSAGVGRQAGLSGGVAGAWGASSGGGGAAAAPEVLEVPAAAASFAVEGGGGGVDGGGGGAADAHTAARRRAGTPATAGQPVGREPRGGGGSHAVARRPPRATVAAAAAKAAAAAVAAGRRPVATGARTAIATEKGRTGGRGRREEYREGESEAL